MLWYIVYVWYYPFFSTKTCVTQMREQYTFQTVTQVSYLILKMSIWYINEDLIEIVLFAYRKMTNNFSWRRGESPLKRGLSIECIVLSPVLQRTCPREYYESNTYKCIFKYFIYYFDYIFNYIRCELVSVIMNMIYVKKSHIREITKIIFLIIFWEIMN
jgi:hypothetical protein